jgi:hypothetical protein
MKTTYWMSCNFCSRDSCSTNFFWLEKPRLVILRFCENYFTNIFVSLVRARNHNPKRHKLGLWFASRSKPTKAAVGNVLPKIYSSRAGLSNKKEFMENECLEQKLQLTGLIYPPLPLLKTKVTGVMKFRTCTLPKF